MTGFSEELAVSVAKQGIASTFGLKHDNVKIWGLRYTHSRREYVG
jgi:hypothetical protein